MSEKKMLKWDGSWTQCKEILGWKLDTGTMELTDHWKVCVLQVFTNL